MNVITNKILEVIKQFQIEKKTSPWSINNGLCDELTRKVIAELDFPHDELFEIEFMNIVNQVNYHWFDFYDQAIEPFNLKPTRNLNKELFMETLREYADTSHMWIVYKKGDVCLHFDAESPYGVDNPFKLKTFDKYLKVAHLNMNKEELQKYLFKYKQDKVNDFIVFPL